MISDNFTLLCVEDDMDAQENIKMILEEDFKEVFVASDGLEGLYIYKEKKPDIILTDINMPNMDGLSMIKEIRKVDKNQPIIVISAFDSKNNLFKVANLSSSGFIPKPIDMDFLYERLQCIIENLQEKIKLKKLKEKEIENLYKMAHYDTLTKIPNKYLFEITLDKAISKAKRDGSKLAIFFIDLDNFKSINDNYGHESGDIVLQTVSNNIKKIIRNEDILSRRSGDEFLLLVEGFDDIKNLKTLAKKIIEASSVPIKYHNANINISISIGISIYPDDTKKIKQLMHFADQAMYKAKKCGKCNYKFFNDIEI